MTYYEILYWWGFLIIPILTVIFAIIIEDLTSLWVIPFLLGVYIGLGAIMSIIAENTSKFVTTSIVETIPVSTTLTKFGLDVVTDENQLIRFSEYKDIQAWKDGAKLYKMYSYRKCNFGLDSNKIEVSFGKVEQ